MYSKKKLDLVVKNLYKKVLKRVRHDLYKKDNSVEFYALGIQAVDEFLKEYHKNESIEKVVALNDMIFEALDKMIKSNLIMDLEKDFDTVYYKSIVVGNYNLDVYHTANCIDFDVPVWVLFL